MDGKEYLQTREVLSPNDSQTYYQRSGQDIPRATQIGQDHSLGLPRSLNDGYISLNGGQTSGKQSNLSYIFSKSVTESGSNSGYSRMDHDGNRFAKLEPDDMYAVNPNEITKDRGRKKVTSPCLNGTIDGNLNNDKSKDLDFRMDHETLSTSGTPTFHFIDTDDALYARITSDSQDNNFTDSLSLPQPATTPSASTPTSFPSFNDTANSYDDNASIGLQEPFAGQSLYTDSIPPITGGVHGACDDTSMDASFIGDVSSSSEVPGNWPPSIDQVSMGASSVMGITSVRSGVFLVLLVLPFYLNC